MGRRGGGVDKAVGAEGWIVRRGGWGGGSDGEEGKEWD